jgi:hypothetical protein
MTIRLVLAASFLLAARLPAQERATTANGKVVLLYSDGTWKYAPQLDSSVVGRTRSAEATAKVDLAHGKAALYFDPNKWKVTKSDEPSRTTLAHTNGDGYAMILAERLQVPLDQLRQIALDNARSVAPDTKVVAEQPRRVNGIDVLSLQMTGTIQGIHFTYLGYYYTGKEGAIQILTYTAANLFEEYRADFEELLEGFVLTP